MPYVVTADPQVIGDEIERSASALTRDVMTRMWQNLTIGPEEGGTPRDTNFASASWIISIGAPSDRVAGSKEAVDREPAKRGVELIRSYKISWGAVFLVNNTDYIVALNYGWSSQASPGFVEAAYQRALNDFDQIGDIGELQ